MKNSRILIVEDEVILAESHKDKLRNFGIERVILARSKEEALTLLALHPFDLVLLDVRLEKGFEGIELGEYIHEKYAIPFIYLTAHSDKDTIGKMIKSKPHGYLSKPVRKSDLFALVSLVFEQAEEDVVVLTEAGTNYKFNKADITYAESSGNYMLIHFLNREKPFLHRSSVEQLLNLLGPNFAKVNRSTLVNITHVSSLSKKEITVANEVFMVSKGCFEGLERSIRE